MKAAAQAMGAGKVANPDFEMLVVHEQRLHEAKRGAHLLSLLASMMQQAEGDCLAQGKHGEVCLRYDDLSATLDLVREQVDITPDAVALPRWRELKAA